MLKNLHTLFAFVSIGGFLLRVVWLYTQPDKLAQKWVKIAPHVVDTCLLGLGLALVFSYGLNLLDAWLLAKLLALVCYIGFGVMTLRGAGVTRTFGLVGALASISYIFLVAYGKTPWPF